MGILINIGQCVYWVSCWLGILIIQTLLHIKSKCWVQRGMMSYVGFRVHRVRERASEREGCRGVRVLSLRVHGCIRRPNATTFLLL